MGGRRILAVNEIYSSVRVFKRLLEYILRRPLPLLVSILLIILMPRMSSIVPVLTRFAIDHDVIVGE